MLLPYSVCYINMQVVHAYFLNVVDKMILIFQSLCETKALLCSSGLILWLYVGEQSCDTPLF